jgi:hypothetical protein
MRTRTISVVALGAAALMLPAVASGPATATSVSGSTVAVHAAAVASHGTVAAQAKSKMTPNSLCNTSYGPIGTQEDGIIAWNDNSGTTFDTGGAADFRCTGGPAARTINTVQVWGYFGSSTGTDAFNVTFYKNSNANGSAEPNDNKVLCDYSGLPGASGFAYPGGGETVLQLTKPCKLKKKAARHAWVRVQNANPAGPWYWQKTSGTYMTQADWRDVHAAFGVNCTSYNDDIYLADAPPQCLGYAPPDYQDWQLILN